MTRLFNNQTENLPPYPMEELKKIKQDLISRNIAVFDFGTGDPKIPLWQEINVALAKNLPKTSQYPSILGSPELELSHSNYLKRRYGIDDPNIAIIPTRGSKEGIFHIALSLVGRLERKRILYPTPGYPVYKNSAVFAQGIPTPILLTPKHAYQMKPWLLPANIIEETAACWVNYPHNPTGTMVDKEYWLKLIEWCQAHDIILLSDECYTDIYNSTFDESDSSPIPSSPLCYASNGILSFMSLSKRSGMTGYRAGFIAGDKNLIAKHAKARASFGLGQPKFIQDASIVAWNDDEHVKQRRLIFSERMNYAGQELIKLGLLESIPNAGFYLWCKVPARYKANDEEFCIDLAKKGVITLPSRWLGEQAKGYFRLAMVPSLEETKLALPIIKEMLK